jgi:hypothetical protein
VQHLKRQTTAAFRCKQVNRSTGQHKGGAPHEERNLFMMISIERLLIWLVLTIVMLGMLVHVYRADSK